MFYPSFSSVRGTSSTKSPCGAKELEVGQCGRGPGTGWWQDLSGELSNGGGTALWPIRLILYIQNIASQLSLCGGKYVTSSILKTAKMVQLKMHFLPSFNQVRFDFIFESGDMAASFHSEVKSNWEELRLPKAVKRCTFLFTEEAFGFGQEPVLSEDDLFSMTSQAQQLFRFFIKCQVFEEGGNIFVRFNNLSDLNLFLYNKVKSADRRTLGTLRQYVSARRMRCDDSGQFRLFSVDLQKPFDSEMDFEVKEGELDGKKVTFLCFATKFDLFKFFISEDAKTIQYLDIDPGLIEEIDIQEECSVDTSIWEVEVKEDQVAKNVEAFNTCQFMHMILQEKLVQGWKLCQVFQLKIGHVSILKL